MYNLLYVNLTTTEVEIIRGPIWSDGKYIESRLYTQLKKTGRISYGDRYAIVVTPNGTAPDLAKLKYVICEDIYAIGRRLS